MLISFDYPPNYEEIKQFLHFNPLLCFFAYGSTLYNPGQNKVEEHYLVHEEVHERQQAKFGVKAWWHRYLRDPAFRISQEVEAYRAQFRFLKSRISNLEKQRALLNEFATILSGPVYGEAISFREARRALETTPVITKPIRVHV